MMENVFNRSSDYGAGNGRNLRSNHSDYPGCYADGKDE